MHASILRTPQEPQLLTGQWKAMLMALNWPRPGRFKTTYLAVFGFQWNIVWFQLDIQSANVCHNSFSKGLAIKAFAMNACQHIGYHWLLFRIHMASAATNVTRVEKYQESTPPGENEVGGAAGLRPSLPAGAPYMICTSSLSLNWLLLTVLPLGSRRRVARSRLRLSNNRRHHHFQPMLPGIIDSGSDVRWRCSQWSCFSDFVSAGSATTALPGMGPSTLTSRCQKWMLYS